MPDAPPALPRFGLALVSLLHALVFLGAAFGLGWRWSWAVATPGLVLGLLHLNVAVFAVLRHPLLPTVWRATSWASLIGLLWLATEVLRSAVFVATLYAGLGSGLALALLCVVGLLALFTLPFLCWGFAVVGFGLERKGRKLGQLGAISLGALALLFAATPLLRRVHALPHPEQSQLDQLIVAEAGPAAGDRDEDAVGAAFQKPFRCQQPPGEAQLTALVTPLSGKKSPLQCLQADDLPGLLTQIEGGLTPGVAHSVDFIASLTSLHEGDLFDPLKLRPGLDGVCSERLCLAPWQLLASESFSSYRPLSFLPDFQFGISFVELRDWLTVNSEARLQRIATAHYLLSPGQPPQLLQRLRPAAVTVDEPALHAAADLAQRHVLSAQLASGSFRYSLEPMSGERQNESPSLARQAGTTLALCEVGRDVPRQAIAAALGALEGAAHRQGNYSFLQLKSERRPRLPSNTLPLAALLGCRAKVGERFDPLIARLSRFLLQMQREDGSFYPEFNPKKRRPREGHEPLFAPGQGVLALVLLYREQRARPNEDFPDLQTVQDAARRAMHHVAHEHWNHPLYDYFFVEENWNCLAARAALAHDELIDADYQQFCFDYVAFRGQFILQPGDASPDFTGGLGSGDVIPPHNTGTAGFVEALAAAISVKQSRGLDTSVDLQRLNLALGFLLRQQWTPETSAFARDAEVQGALSEHTHSLSTRIDFVQHAWSAIAHGRALLASES